MTKLASNAGHNMPVCIARLHSAHVLFMDAKILCIRVIYVIANKLQGIQTRLTRLRNKSQAATLNLILLYTYDDACCGKRSGAKFQIHWQQLAQELCVSGS